VEEGVLRVMAPRSAVVVLGQVLLFGAVLVIGLLGPPSWSDLGLGALVGALVGAASAHLLSELTQGRREEREKRGLLRLVSIEIAHNEKRCQLLRAIPGYVFSEQIDLIKMDTWASARTRLVQLLPSDDLGRLTSYYAPLQELVYIGHSAAHERWSGVPATTRSIEDRAKELLEEVEEARRSVDQMIEGHLGNADGDTSDLPLTSS
jgi:hypothetical protein